MTCILPVLLLLNLAAGQGQSLDLIRMAAEDQADRQFKSRPSPEEETRMKTNDRERQMRAREILRHAAKLKAEEFSAAALIFQHGQTAQDYALAHQLSICAGSLGKIESLPALTEDRFLEAIHRLQRFGTQFSWAGTGTKLNPIDSGKPTSVTDDLRLNYMLPPVSLAAKLGIAANQAAQVQVFARLELRRNPHKPLAGNPAVSRDLKRLRPNARGIKRVLAYYATRKIATDADLDNAARVLLGSSDPDVLLLAHEFAALAFMEGCRPSGPLASAAWDKFCQRVHREDMTIRTMPYSCLATQLVRP